MGDEGVDTRQNIIESTAAEYTNLIFQKTASSQGKGNDRRKSARVPSSALMDEVDNILESSLVRADELNAIFQTVKAESNTATDVLLPQLSQHCQELTRMFEVIDALVAVVASLKCSAEELDSRLKKVQHIYDLRHPSGFDRLLGSVAGSMDSGKSSNPTGPPEMPPWDKDSFIADTSPIFKEARLRWLETGAGSDAKEGNVAKQKPTIDV